MRSAVLVREYPKGSVCLSYLDGPRECHSELSKADREGEISYDILYMWNLKRNYINELTYKSERDSQTSKQTYGYQGEGIVREFGAVMYTLLLLLSHFNRVLLCGDPINGNPPGSPVLGFSRQEHWSGVPLPSPHVYTATFKIDNQQGPIV